jgi:hypothetical protein
MTTELKGNSMKPNSEEILLMDMQCTIERLENELLAATIRIDNDAMEIARLTPLQYRQAPCHKFCEATAFNIEIRALKAELSKVTDELFALSQDDGKVERALDRANAEINKLRSELAKIELQEPVAFLELSRVTGEWFLSYITKKDVNQKPLYLAPGAQPVNIEAMVSKFLQWELPADFAPDCHISFDVLRAQLPLSWPTGTNLFSAAQARKMIEAMLDAVPKECVCEQLNPYATNDNHDSRTGSAICAG